MRRYFATILILMQVSGAVGAQEPVQPDRLDAAINAGLSYLVRQQNAEGAFDGGGAPKVAMTGLSLMSHLASGHTPDDGRFGANVRRALDYLIHQAPEDGYFGKLDNSRMYGHGIVTLALAEAYGVEPQASNRALMRPILERAVADILKAHDIPKNLQHAGGWRYELTSNDSDISLSGWNILALRAAGNIGIEVPNEHLDRARAYVLQCYNKLQHGFGYQPRAEASISMTGVAVLNLFLLDASDRDEVVHGVQYILDHPVNNETRFPYYTMYYTTQSAFQAGEPAWPIVWNQNRQRLLKSQLPDGGWPQSASTEEPGRVYATSLAVLTLSVPYRLLPTYQR